VLASVLLVGVGLVFGSGGTLALGIGLRFAAVVVLGLLVGGAILGSFGSFVGVRRSLAT
jgi:hypothetical protein